MNLETCRTGGAELYHRLHLPTYPVSVTYIRSEEKIPEKAVRPSSGIFTGRGSSRGRWC